MTFLYSTVDSLQTLSVILAALLLMPLMMDVTADSYTYSPIISMPPATTIPPIAVVENKDGGRTSYASSIQYESDSTEGDEEEKIQIMTTCSMKVLLD